MDPSDGFIFVVEIILLVGTSSCASFETHPLIGDISSSDYNFREPPSDYYLRASPDYYPQGPPSQEGRRPEENYAYTEVMTPYYHYYFYAPYFKTRFLQNPHLMPSSWDGYVPNKAWRIPQDNYFIQEDRISSGPHNLEEEYYSPKFNEVKYPTYEVSTQNSKLNRNNFLDKPFSASFNPYEQHQPTGKSTHYISPSFLPTALSSAGTNIIRKEDQGTIMQANIFRPYSYAPTFKDHTPHIFEPSLSNKPALNPSLFSSASPNVIRDKVSPINKLFKPISSSKPILRTPNYSSVPQISFGGKDHTWSSISSLVPTSTSSTSSPFPFHTSSLPNLAVDETYSPLFPSSQTPLEGVTSPASVNVQSPSERPRLLFEAPGHTHPSRR